MCCWQFTVICVLQIALQMVYECRLLYEVQEQYPILVSTCPLNSHSQIILQLQFISVEVNEVWKFVHNTFGRLFINADQEGWVVRLGTCNWDPVLILAATPAPPILTFWLCFSPPTPHHPGEYQSFISSRLWSLPSKSFPFYHLPVIRPSSLHILRYLQGFKVNYRNFLVTFQ